VPSLHRAVLLDGQATEGPQGQKEAVISAQGPAPPSEDRILTHFFCSLKTPPKGSFRAFLPRGARQPIVVASNADAVRHFSGECRISAWQERRGPGPVDCPVKVEAVFLVARPRTHYFGAGYGGIRPQYREAQPSKRGSGDLDKLSRSLLDAMTGVIYVDDSQVVALVAGSVYARESGVWVRVSRIPHQELRSDLCPGISMIRPFKRDWSPSAEDAWVVRKPRRRTKRC
jgi:Holliday junction resolvase RusA-like endonuclease